MYFELIGEITNVETIAAKRTIHEMARLEKRYGTGRWCKMKGVAHVRLQNGQIRLAELHWYEAHGIGKKRMKVKRILG